MGCETRLGHHLTSKNDQPTRESATGGAAHQHGGQVADCEKVHQTIAVATVIGGIGGGGVDISL